MSEEPLLILLLTTENYVKEITAQRTMKHSLDSSRESSHPRGPAHTRSQKSSITQSPHLSRSSQQTCAPETTRTGPRHQPSLLPPGRANTATATSTCGAAAKTNSASEDSASEESTRQKRHAQELRYSDFAAAVMCVYSESQCLHRKTSWLVSPLTTDTPRSTNTQAVFLCALADWNKHLAAFMV